MKRLFPAAAVVALMSMPAFAQTATAPAQSNPPAATAPAASPAVNAMADDISANKLINKSVKNAANESVGDINDVLLSSDGKVSAVIIGVGGFLGMGEKDVALPFDQLTFAKDSSGDLMVSTSATKDSLQSAPEYVKPENRS